MKVIVTLLLTFTFALCRRQGTRRDQPCSDATDVILDESFRMLTGVVPSTLRRTSDTRRYTFLSGERKCTEERDPSFTRHGNLGHVVNSTCPGYFILNYDPVRTPAMIVEVRCACIHACMEVTYYRRVHVLKAKSAEYERVSVGCARRDEIVSRPDPPKSHD